KDRKVLEGALASGNAGGVAGLILSALASASAHSLSKKRGSLEERGEKKTADVHTMPAGGEGAGTEPVQAVRGDQEAGAPRGGEHAPQGRSLQRLSSAESESESLPVPDLQPGAT